MKQPINNVTRTNQFSLQVMFHTKRKAVLAHKKISPCIYIPEFHNDAKII